METFSHFTYNPLDTLQSEIRLISLQPSQHDNDIECQLLSANLDEQPVFEALSYEWGPPTPLSHCSWIKLDGHNSPVRENLRAALSCLRFKDKARIIWIDALCINQKDVKERNHQVAQMGKIYSQASRVIAWLGREEFEVYGAAIGFLDNLSRSSTKLSQLPIPSIVQLGGLLALCSRSYWERLWIIQELVLAKAVIVHCGSLTFDLNLFGFIERSLLQEIDYCERLKILNSLPLKIVKLRQEGQELRRGGDEIGSDSESDSEPDLEVEVEHRTHTELGDSSRPGFFIHNGHMGTLIKGKSPLLDVMYEASLSMCMDRRDKVFGLLNLSRRCCRLTIRPNYSSSLEGICQSILNHHLSVHSNKRSRLSYPSTKSGSPILVMKKILDSLGLKFTKSFGEPANLFREQNLSFEPALCQPIYADAELLYNASSRFQQVVVTVETPKVDQKTGKLLIDTFMPEKYCLQLKGVLDAARNGSLKPRFIFAEPLEGEELYFKPDSRFDNTISGRSVAFATVPFDSIPNLSGIPNPRNGPNQAQWQRLAARSSTVASNSSIEDAYGNPKNQVYIPRSWAAKPEPKAIQPHEAVPTENIRRIQEEWDTLLRSRGENLARQRLKVFVTDGGQVGYATQHCKKGDFVSETSDGSHRVAIFEGSYDALHLEIHKLVGKGILLRHDVELSGPEKKAELLKKWHVRSHNESSDRVLDMHLDFPSLLFLSGYY